ncbi:phosphoribosylformylglycinamidine synthase subunit PurS [Lacticaseibacillus zhaodongensis]|uniref:phosphoribosylformylglycinamidine synthase subunit PurS n=1 Tax=Lacticaseibacillus zhaodongensis TaxID=2668065 RepID=UPI0012D35FE3|nr:phosphoribosylformylglycinamidine synthase subunit PurS [Lacticaseibacillus zhaodongensis]
MNFLAKIHVNYKPSVLDPKAEAIKTALTRMSMDNVSSVLYGKYFELELTADSVAAANTQVDRICDELLANVNMETYRFELEEQSEVRE